MDLSVIIPTLDEAQALPGLLQQLRAQQGLACEVVVADGGSADDTVALAQADGAHVTAAPRGRGAQMNAGARLARGEFLLFLHADSRLPSGGTLAAALAALRTAIAAHGPRCAGHFPLRFVRRGGGHDFFYRYLEAKTALNRPGTINGDQGLLLAATYFQALGGFDERLPFLEDQRIAARIFEDGRWQVLPERLETSARRFEAEGAYRRYTLMSLIMGLHAAGADAFFTRAPRVYAAQSETGRLRLGPYLALARRVLREAGWRGASTMLLRAGRYARQNLWQMFFAVDVARGRAANPRLLRFHDRRMAPLLNHAAADVLAALLLAAWFLAVLPAACAVLERGPAAARTPKAITGGRAD